MKQKTNSEHVVFVLLVLYLGLRMILLFLSKFAFCFNIGPMES